MSKYHFNVYRIIVYVFVQFPDYPIRSVIRRILNFLYVNSQFFKGHYTEINLGGGNFGLFKFKTFRYSISFRFEKCDSSGSSRGGLQVQVGVLPQLGPPTLCTPLQFRVGENGMILFVCQLDYFIVWKLTILNERSFQED